MRLVVIGYGYSASATAGALLREGARLTATVRHLEGRHKPEGATLIAYDGSAFSPALEAALASATHLLVSAPPDEAGDPLLRHHAGVLETARALRWIGYFSTIGVYGDAGGGWIDENSVTRPSTHRSALRVEAERAWQAVASQTGVPVAILRLAGIYGPGRSALDSVREGTARRIVKPGQVFNRIHRDDIARWTAALAANGKGGLYNLCDNEPAPPQDVVAFAARLLEQPVPEAVAFEESDLSPMGRSFYGETKRVSSRAIQQATGLCPLYPSYREAFIAALDV